MVWLLLYFLLSFVFLINLIMNILVLEYVRQAVSVRERPKLVEKIDKLKELRKFSIVWPYVLYKLINKK
jgi:1,4-dihydroxy-2-naphthoate octaprenyltransferase